MRDDDTRRMNTNDLITLVLALSIPEQARICDALLESLNEIPPDADAIAESERMLECIDEVLDELPVDAKLGEVMRAIDAKISARMTSC